MVYLRDLVWELVLRDIKLRYNRSLLGIGWSLAVPLAQLAILKFVFGVVLRMQVPDFTSFLFSGLLPWSWFSSSLVAVTKTTQMNQDLVRQPGFPLGILPVVTITSQMCHFLMALPILFFFLWVEGHRPSPALALLPAVMGLQFLLTLGVAYLLIPLQALFHDTEHLLGLALMVLFYLTPTFYEASMVPEPYAFVYSLNPLVALLGAYRAILMQGAAPSIGYVAGLLALVVVLVVVGYRFFQHHHFNVIWER